MADFEPARVAAQIPALQNLIDKRNQLRDLLAKADRSEDLENLLEQILQSDADMRQLAGDLSKRADSSGQPGETS